MMKGWILDVYPDLNKGKMIVWFKTKRQCYKLVEDHGTPFYVRAKERDHSEIEKTYGEHGFKTRMVRKKLDIRRDKERSVLEISPGKVFDPRITADALNFFNGHTGLDFYNIDIPADISFLTEKNIMPSSYVDKNDGWTALDTPECVHYSSPIPNKMYLEIETDGKGLPSNDNTLKAVILDEERIAGDEDHILEEVNRYIRRKDPDVIITSGGDSFVIPYLFHRAELNSVELVLGREPSSFSPKRGSSYHSYGRVLYRPPAYMLKGRIHIDSNSSFMYHSGGLDGLIEISRLSKIPLQRLSRLSPGTAIDSMELVHVIKEGYLIPWKRNFTEGFKTVSKLIVSDRGGHIFEPKVGIHENILKFDFASMYPSIIDKYNLSPETLVCDPTAERTVPGLGYGVSENERGLIPSVVAPVIKRRQYYKHISRGDDKFKRRADCLKWLLVTCFGYTGYKKARFGSIEVHESITAYGREILLEAADIAQDMGYEVIHGIVDSLWLKGNENIDEFLRRVNERTGIELEWEGRYSWLVFSASKTDPGIGVPNRYFGKLNDKIEVRGIHLRRKDTPPFFKKVQESILESMKNADTVEELKECIPDCLRVVKRCWKRLMHGDVQGKRLLFTKTAGKNAADYKHMTEMKAALLKYRDMSLSIHPGQKVRYMVTADTSKVAVEGEYMENYDRKYYADYLFRVAGELLESMGYPEDAVKKITVTQALPLDSPLTTPEAII